MSKIYRGVSNEIASLYIKRTPINSRKPSEPNDTSTYEKVLQGAAAFGVAGVAVVALVGVAALAFYVTSKN